MIVDSDGTLDDLTLAEQTMQRAGWTLREVEVRRAGQSTRYQRDFVATHPDRFLPSQVGSDPVRGVFFALSVDVKDYQEHQGIIEINVDLRAGSPTPLLLYLGMIAELRGADTVVVRTHRVFSKTLAELTASEDFAHFKRDFGKRKMILQDVWQRRGAVYARGKLCWGAPAYHGHFAITYGEGPVKTKLYMEGLPPPEVRAFFELEDHPLQNDGPLGVTVTFLSVEVAGVKVPVGDERTVFTRDAMQRCAPTRLYVPEHVRGSLIVIARIVGEPFTLSTRAVHPADPVRLGEHVFDSNDDNTATGIAELPFTNVVRIGPLRLQVVTLDAIPSGQRFPRSEAYVRMIGELAERDLPAACSLAKTRLPHGVLEQELRALSQNLKAHEPFAPQPEWLCAAAVRVGSSVVVLRRVNDAFELLDLYTCVSVAAPPPLVSSP